jgi:hypothetical protein
MTSRRRRAVQKCATASRILARVLSADGRPVIHVPATPGPMPVVPGWKVATVGGEFVFRRAA